MCFCFGAETGGERVQADHTGHTGGEDHGSAEIQDEHRQQRHHPGQRLHAEHGHRPGAQPVQPRQGEIKPSFFTLQKKAVTILHNAHPREHTNKLFIEAVKT